MIQINQVLIFFIYICNQTNNISANLHEISLYLENDKKKWQCINILESPVHLLNRNKVDKIMPKAILNMPFLDDYIKKNNNKTVKIYCIR